MVQDDDEIEEGEISDDDGNYVAVDDELNNAGLPSLNLINSPITTTPTTDEETESRAESQLGKQLQNIRDLISSVTVTETCSSPERSCSRIREALVMIEELGVLPGDDAFATQLLGKIQLLFRVYSALEQDRKSQVNPSLRRLADLLSEKVFTSDHLQELKLLFKVLEPETIKSEEAETKQRPETSAPSYLPWNGAVSGPNGRKVVVAPSYDVYISSYHMDDLPSPTPSDEDIAARYGKEQTGVTTAVLATQPQALIQATQVQAQPQSQLQPLETPEQSQDIQNVQLKTRDPRKGLVGGMPPNSGKPRVASILKKRESSESMQMDSKRQRLSQADKIAEPSGGSGGWLEPDFNDEEEQPVMKPRDPRRARSPSSNNADSGSREGSPQRLSPQGQANDLPTMQSSVNGHVTLDLDTSVSLHPELREILEGLDGAERAAFLKERERRMNEHEMMIKDRKLCLVLDLDHTLLNSAKFSEIEPQWDQFLRGAELIERTRERKELYRFPHMAMWTKLRPGIWRFLARASQLYEMHLYTMGNRAYATEMAKLLDPTGALFAGRVISKGDEGVAAYGDEKIPRSKDLDGVLGMESAVLIIDDSSRVWPHHAGNLVVVERYLYFPSSRRQFGLPGPSLLEVGHDEREADGMLSSILAVIERVHCNFFGQPIPKEVDVRKTLAQEQQSILKGCKIVFSRIFPVGEMQPQLYPLWRLAEQFGALCTTIVEEDVTHVVATSMGTDKVNWALATGKHLVRPAWLEASTILYRRANERDFPVPA